MKNIYTAIQSEIDQQSSTRRRFFNQIERSPPLEGRSLVTFFTSFIHPVQIEDNDCDALEALLQKLDVSKGLVLMISSPGGNGLAAERMVNICRAYSGTGDYWAVVPGKAKSAATIVCMGASKILMGGSSELGPVDPQIFLIEDGKRKTFSLHNLVKAYDELFDNAVKAPGNLAPYLQQLLRFDHREVVTYRSLIQLANDIAKKVLRTGMMSGNDLATIETQIQVFLNPSAGTLAHGRPIFMPEACSCGLNCEQLEVKAPLWRDIYELYVRTNVFVSRAACKAIECRQEAFHVPVSVSK